MTDYILTADFFDQIVERRPDRSPQRIVKHRRGAILSDLTEGEIERLTSTGAIKPYAAPVLVDDGDDDVDPDAEPGEGEPDQGDPGDDQEPAAEPVGPASVGRPLKTATAVEWREYAVSQGLPKDEAAALNRAELIARYGGN